MPAADIKTRSIKLSLRLKNPAMATEKNNTPNSAVIDTCKMPPKPPCNKSAGQYTKRKGSMKPGKAIFQATYPVYRGGEPESPEAAYAPKATGGVMKEYMP